MANFNERTNTLLYKNIYISHFILIVSVVCERWVETGTDRYIDPTSSPDHSSTFFLILPGVAQPGGRWEPQPSVYKLFLNLTFLPPTNSTAAGTCLYSFITSTCFLTSLSIPPHTLTNNAQGQQQQKYKKKLIEQ